MLKIKLINSIKNLLNTNLFTFKNLVKIYFFFIFILIIGNIITIFTCANLPIAEVPVIWPISNGCFRFFIPEVNVYSLSFPQFIFVFENFIVVLIYTFFFLLLLKYLNYIKKPVFLYLIGIGSVFLSNLIQGYYNGFIYPLVGEVGKEYLGDAIKITDSLSFIRNYNSIQTSLFCHSRTHPPGAVLVYKFANDLFSDPLIIGLVIMCVSLLSIFYIYKLIKEWFNEDTAIFICLLFIFLPATQIYYLSSLDSLIAFFFLATFYYYLKWSKNNKFLDYILCVMFLFFSIFLTYMVIFLFLLLFICLIKDKNFKRIVFLFLPIVIVFLGFYYLLNFNYITGFLTTSKLENPHGFLFLNKPLLYFLTRFEDVAEILLFSGPLVIFFVYQGLKNKTNKLVTLSRISIIVLFLLFLIGAYRTGETARGCLFIYPFLLIPIAFYFFNRGGVNIFEKRQILFLLWVQSTIMQIIIFYVW